MLKKSSEKNKETEVSSDYTPVNLNQALSTSLEKNIEMLNAIFIDDDTIATRWITNCHNTILQYCIVQNDGLVSSAIINQNIIKPLMLSEALLNKGQQIDTLIQQVLFVNQIKRTKEWQEIIEAVTYGDTILFVDGEKEALLLNSKGFNVRGIDEPSGEKILSGPREGFCEALMTNLSLVKRRLRTNELKIKFQSLGVKTKTQVCICYIDSIVNKKVLEELQRRLEKIEIDGVLDSHYITDIQLGQKKC
jgi:spore germination protein KA